MECRFGNWVLTRLFLGNKTVTLAVHLTEKAVISNLDNFQSTNSTRYYCAFAPLFLRPRLDTRNGNFTRKNKNDIFIRIYVYLIFLNVF